MTTMSTSTIRVFAVAIISISAVFALLSLKHKPRTITVKVVWSEVGCYTEPGIFRVYENLGKERKIESLLKLDPENPLGAHTQNAQRVHMTIMHLSQKEYAIAQMVDTTINACAEAKIYTLKSKTSQAGFFTF